MVATAVGIGRSRGLRETEKGRPPIQTIFFLLAPGTGWAGGTGKSATNGCYHLPLYGEEHAIITKYGLYTKAC
jgi:hypothetical protein